MIATSSRVAAGSLSVALLLGAGACLPIPHTEPIAPAIDGRVVDQAGEPVAGARVALSTEWEDNGCTSPRVTAITGTDGRFEFAPVRKRFTWMPLMGDWFHRYRVCSAGAAERFWPAFVGMLAIHSSTPVSLTCKPAAGSPLASTPVQCVAERRRQAAAARTP